jgi:hypothetical protein
MEIAVFMVCLYFILLVIQRAILLPVPAAERLAFLASATEDLIWDLNLKVGLVPAGSRFHVPSTTPGCALPRHRPMMPGTLAAAQPGMVPVSNVLPTEVIERVQFVT